MLISENNMNTSTYFVHILSLLYAMKLLVIFGIKIYRKLASCLTYGVCLKWFPSSFYGLGTSWEKTYALIVDSFLETNNRGVSLEVLGFQRIVVWIKDLLFKDLAHFLLFAWESTDSKSRMILIFFYGRNDPIFFVHYHIILIMAQNQHDS